MDATILTEHELTILLDYAAQAREAWPIITALALVIALLAAMLAREKLRRQRQQPDAVLELLFDLYRIVSIWGLFVAAAGLLLVIAPGSFVYANVIATLAAVALLLVLRIKRIIGLCGRGESGAK